MFLGTTEKECMIRKNVTSGIARSSTNNDAFMNSNSTQKATVTQSLI